MSEKDKIEQRNILNAALKDSFMKMLALKKKLGQPVVTSDENGNPVILTAEDAEELVCKGS